jgi:hypothetical protein
MRENVRELAIKFRTRDYQGYAKELKIIFRTRDDQG